MARPPKARKPIKDAALQLFVESGIHATGIREIAKAAGCSEAALYRHWANKDALVASLFKEHLQEVNHALEQAIAEAPTFPEKVLAAAKTVYQLYDDEPLVFRFVLLVQHELAKHLDADVRTPHDVVTDLVNEGVAMGEVKGDPALLASWLSGIFLNTATYVLYGRLPPPMSSYAVQVAEVSLRILRG